MRLATSGGRFLLTALNIYVSITENKNSFPISLLALIPTPSAPFYVSGSVLGAEE